MSDRLNVLDYGYVRLVESMGSDLSIVRAARVSYDAAWRVGQDQGSDHRLIHYLWRNRHTTPFEAVELQFEVKAPIFVLRQWMRHRTWTWNELSARYRELPEEFYVPEPGSIGVQSTSNKQGRDFSGEVDTTSMTTDIMRRANMLSFDAYRMLLKADVPRELARTVLPLSTYSHTFAKVDLRNLFGFLDLRDHPHAQHEIRLYAEALRELARGVAPVAIAAWESDRNIKEQVA